VTDESVIHGACLRRAGSHAASGRRSWTFTIACIPHAVLYTTNIQSWRAVSFIVGALAMVGMTSPSSAIGVSCGAGRAPLIVAGGSAMAIALYDLSVANYLQTLGGVVGFLEKGFDHFAANEVGLGEIVETRLFPDMLPFRFQLQSVAHHSLGAIEGLKRGIFQPSPPGPAYDYRGLQQLIADAQEALQKVTPAEVNELEGKDVVFQFRDFKIPFTAEGFVLSFSLPNFYFHATTAYDILRMKGVPIGKRDYMGAMRLKS